MVLKSVPQAIVLECVREQERTGWPDSVPMYAEIPVPSGKTVWQEHKYLTVSDCEQLVEHHTRKANRAIERFIRTNSMLTAKTAALHMVRARLYRVEYLVKMGIENATEDDMPFPVRNLDD